MTAKRKAAVPAANAAVASADATEAAREDLARQAEAVTPPGGDAGEILQGQIEERPDDADPGECIVTGIHVRALVDGFRRAGRAWPAAGVEVPAGEYDADQLAALLDEPMLVVTLLGHEVA